MNKKYLFSGLLVVSLLGLAFFTSTQAKAEIKNGIKENKGWQTMSRPEVLGTVTAVSGSTITVKDLRGNTNIIYTVNATNATIIKNGQASTVSNILVNDTIAVQGVINNTNIIATKINDRVFNNKEKEIEKNKKLNAENNLNNPVVVGDGSPIVAGTVATISGNTITIKNKSNVIYTIDTINAKIQSQGAVSTIASVAVGNNVIAQGTINGTSVTATLIIDQKPAPIGGQADINKPEIKNQNNNSENQNIQKPAPKKGGIFNWFKSLFGF